MQLIPQKRVLKHEKLKEKLKAEYSLSPTVKRKVRKDQNVSQPIKLEESKVEQDEGEGKGEVEVEKEVEGEGKGKGGEGEGGGEEKEKASRRRR